MGLEVLPVIAAQNWALTQLIGSGDCEYEDGRDPTGGSGNGVVAQVVSERAITKLASLLLFPVPKAVATQVVEDAHDTASPVLLGVPLTGTAVVVHVDPDSVSATGATV